MILCQITAPYFIAVFLVKNLSIDWFNLCNHTGGDIAEAGTVGVGGMAGRRGSPAGLLLPQQSKTPGGPAVGITADGTGSAV